MLQQISSASSEPFGSPASLFGQSTPSFNLPEVPFGFGFAPQKEEQKPVINSGPLLQHTSLFGSPLFSPQQKTRQILCELYPEAGVQIAEEDVKKLADAGYYAKFLLEHPDRVTLERINLPAPLVDYLVNTPTIKSLQESVESLRSTIVDIKENLPKILKEAATASQHQHQPHLSNKFC